MYRIMYRFLVPGWSAKPLVSAYDRILGTHTQDGARNPWSAPTTEFWAPTGPLPLLVWLLITAGSLLGAHSSAAELVASLR